MTSLFYFFVTETVYEAGAFYGIIKCYEKSI